MGGNGDAGGFLDPGSRAKDLTLFSQSVSGVPSEVTLMMPDRTDVPSMPSITS